ncbi:MAG: transcriptional regulator [Chromatiales bacterium 21-64-14]|nr:MAG: transcriptional regulator [Chromatiales bacterium 21-64-14]
MNPTQFFKALADPTRLRCVVLLQAEGELCVCELTHALGLIQPKISRHLALLRASGVVQDRRDGFWVHYRIHPDLPAWAQDAIRETNRGLAGLAPFSSDRRALAAMPNRPGEPSCCAPGVHG